MEQIEILCSDTSPKYITLPSLVQGHLPFNFKILPFIIVVSDKTSIYNYNLNKDVSGYVDKNMKNQTAFTLIELMVVVALIAILTMYAIPNMRAMLVNNRIVTKTNQLIQAFNYARSEAITDANKLIQVIAIDDDWRNGWEILDTSTNPGTVLKVFKFKNDQIDVSVVGSNNTDFSYTSRGYLRTQIIFNICNADYPARGRRITVKQTGRANTEIRTCN